jgi:hypothetical protein
MLHLGTVRCTHREISGTASNWVVTFRASEKDFGCSLILRIRDDEERYKIGNEYTLGLEVLPGVERRKEPRG